MLSSIDNLLKEGIGSTITSLGNCDVNVEGLCCYYKNQCVSIAKCQSNTKPNNLIDIAKSLPKCVCPDGYTGDGRINGTGCTNINECDNGTHGCSDICIDLIPGYRCECNPGFALKSDGQTCADINECKSNQNKCSHLCVNTTGGFYCSCPPGYELQSDGITCVDIDECASTVETGFSVCQFDDLCVNIPGSFRCGCPPGFIPVSNRCVDVDECTELGRSACPNSSVKNMFGKVIQTQFCTNVYGGHICSCKNPKTFEFEEYQGFEEIPILKLFAKQAKYTHDVVLEAYNAENDAQKQEYLTMIMSRVEEYFTKEVESDHFDLTVKALKDRKNLLNRHNKALKCNAKKDCSLNPSVCGLAANCVAKNGRFTCVCINVNKEFDDETGKCVTRNNFISELESSTPELSKSMSALMNRLTWNGNMPQPSDSFNHISSVEFSQKHGSNMTTDVIHSIPLINNEITSDLSRQNKILNPDLLKIIPEKISGTENNSNALESLTSLFEQRRISNINDIIALDNKILDPELIRTINQSGLLSQDTQPHNIDGLRLTSFKCPLGTNYFNLRDNNHLCFEINECSLLPNLCADSSTCIDTKKAYICNCTSGITEGSVVPFFRTASKAVEFLATFSDDQINKLLERYSGVALAKALLIGSKNYRAFKGYRYNSIDEFLNIDYEKSNMYSIVFKDNIGSNLRDRTDIISFLFNDIDKIIVNKCVLSD